MYIQYMKYKLTLPKIYIYDGAAVETRAIEELDRNNISFVQLVRKRGREGGKKG